jgi:hypothetical protein
MLASLCFKSHVFKMLLADDGGRSSKFVVGNTSYMSFVLEIAGFNNKERVIFKEMNCIKMLI